jgi:hypothetical protein
VRIGIVLARRGDLALAVAMTRAALRAGDEVRWFAMDDGVRALVAEEAASAGDPGDPGDPSDARQPAANAPDGRGGSALLEDLDELEVIACATSVDARAVSLPAQIALGSQDDHAALVAWADRTVSLT